MKLVNLRRLPHKIALSLKASFIWVKLGTLITRCHNSAQHSATTPHNKVPQLSRICSENRKIADQVLVNEHYIDTLNLANISFICFIKPSQFSKAVKFSE